MSPGYVRRHPRILSARLERADWDSSLTANVDLVIPQPPSLSYLRTDEERGHWRDWPCERRFSSDSVWYEPDTDDLARSPYLLCTASLRFTVPSADLPQPPLPAAGSSSRCAWRLPSAGDRRRRYSTGLGHFERAGRKAMPDIVPGAVRNYG